MPVFLWAWIPTVLKWTKTNPIQALQLAGIAALTAGALFFYFDYQDAKADRISLREDLKAEQALTQAQASRITEFALSQDQQLERLQRVERFNEETRAQVRAALKGLSANDVKQVILENPDEAATILSGRFNALLGMFEYTQAEPDTSPKR